MADVESNININIDTSDALSAIKRLQKEISVFHTAMSQGGARANVQAAQMQQNLINTINATGNFSAQMKTVATSTEAFTTALEKNKFSMGQYFRYAGASSKTFGKLFKGEFDTIEKVARERVKTLQTQYIKLGRDANGAMKTIAVRPLTLDMNDLGTKTAIAAQKQQIFNKLITQGSTNLLNFGKNTQWAGRQLMVGFSVPLAMMGAAASREFMKIEEQALRFKRVYGDMMTTGVETDKMIEQIKGLANEYTKYGVAVEKTIGLAADAAAMGKTGAELMAQVNEASKLSVLGGVDQQKALETTTSLTNAFGVAAEDLGKKINFLNAVENQTVTSIDDLTTAIPIAAPVIKQLGGDVEDLTFMLTAMREGGINASEGANALKSGLAALINPSEKASEMLGEMGVNIKGIVEANKGDVTGTVASFGRALDKLDPLNRARAIEQLFGKFQFSRMSTLFQNINKEGSQASRVMDLAGSSAEALSVLSEREMKKISDSPMFKFQKAVEQFQASMAPVGEAFLKAVTPIVEFGKTLLDKFNGMSEGAKNFTVILVAAVAGIGPVLLMTFGLVANGVANLIKMFAGLAGFFKRLGGGSRVLGEQIDYMSQQQLEAAAAAASLDQSHNRLRQTFTSEAGAVNNLTAAYERAVAAQQRFSGVSIPMAGGKVAGKAKKYAKGVSFVPGTGNKDTQPAMLTPGEAVIPKEMVKRYGPLISGMIAGNIEGFNSGRDPLRVAMGRLRSAPEAVRKQSASADWSSRKQEIAAIKQALKEAGVDNAATTRNLTSTHASHIDPTDTQSAMIGGKSQSIKNWNAKNLIADSGAVNSYMQRLTQAIGKGVLDSFADPKNIDAVIKKTGLNKTEINREIKNLKSGIHPTTAIGAKVLAEVGDFDWKNRDSKSGASYQGLAASSALKAREGSDFYDKDKMRSRAYSSSVDASAAKTTESRIRSAQRVADENTAVKKEETKAVQQRIKTSKKMDEQESQRIVDAKKETKVRIKKTKEELAQIAWQKKYDAADTATKRQMTRERNKQIKDMQASQAVDDAKKQARSEAARRGWETRKANQQAPIPTTTKGGKLSGLMGKMGGISSGKLMGAGMLATTAVGAASMVGGPVGEVAQNIMPVVSGISMLAPLLPMLANPVGAVVGGLVGLGAVAIGLKMAFDGAKDKALELGETLGSGTKAMNSFAEFTGKVTGSQVKDKQRSEALAKMQGVKDLGVGGQFLEGEAGKAMLTSIQEQLKTTDMSNIGELVYNQVATGIATGALDTQTAKSIVMALGAKLKNPSMAIPLNARIDTVFGINGEKLGTDRGQIAANLSAESGRKLDASTTQMNSASGPNKSTGAALQRVAGAWATAGLLAGPTGGISLAVAGVYALTEGVIESVKYFQNLGEASGSLVANGVMALQQNQQLLDSLDLEYEKRIANAKASGDLAKAEELQLEHTAARTKLLDQNKKNIEAAASSYKQADTPGFLGMGNGTATAAMGQAVDKAIENTYKDDPLMQAMAVDTRGKIASAGGLNNTQEYTMKLMLASGDVSPQVLSGILTNFGEDSRVMNATMNIMSNLGTAEGGQILGMANTFINEDGTPNTELQQKFLLQFQAVSSEEAKKMADFYQRVQASGGSIQAVMQLSVEKQADMEKDFQAIEDITKGGTKKVTLEMFAEQTGEDISALKADRAWFDSLDAMSQKYAMQYFVQVHATMTDDDVREWLKNTSSLASNANAGQSWAQTSLANQYSGPVTQAQRDAFAVAQTKNAVTAFQSATQGLDGGAYDGGGGGGGGSEKTVPTELEQLQAQLQLLAKDEEAINKKYEDRLKALDEIQKANEQITQQQQDQMDLADALTKGDMAAAARAMQKVRANNAQRELDRQKEALKTAQENEISSLKYKGKTRKQLEDRIDQLERQALTDTANGVAKASGGYIVGPGTGTSDSIPAMLSNGEYVLQASAVKALGVGALNRLNKATMQNVRSGMASREQRYAVGGLVGPTFSNVGGGGAQVSNSEISGISSNLSSSMSSSATNGESVYNYSINVSAETNANPQDIAKVVIQQIRNIDSQRVRGNYING